MTKLLKSYHEFWKRLVWQFDDYGGLNGLLFSPFLHLAICFSFIELFISQNFSEKSISQFALQVVPSALGVLVAGISMVITFANTIEKIRPKEERDKIAKYSFNLYITLTHMMLVHILAILIAIFIEFVNASWLRFLLNIIELILINYVVLLYVSLSLSLKTVGLVTIDYSKNDDEKNSN